MLKLSPLFCDHAVLQRNQELRIFGESDSPVVVTLAGISVECPAGAFAAVFPPMEAGGPWVLEVKNATEKITAEDILLGDVYLLSGQSNAQFTLGEDEDRDNIPHEDSLARVWHSIRPEGTNPLGHRWVPMGEEDAMLWPALGFYLAQLRRSADNVPVGIVTAFQGAAVLQSFLSPEAVVPFCFPLEQCHWDHREPRFSVWNPPSFLYNYLLRDLYPLSLRGIVWYQGESNTSPLEGAHYDEMLLTLMKEMRTGFRNPALPFVVIQINDFLPAPSQEGWKAVQEAQEKAVLATPASALVKISDLGQHELIHPTNKLPVARRVSAAFTKLFA